MPKFVRLIPKDTSFAKLTTEDASLAACHVSSYTRPKLNAATSIDLAAISLPKRLLEFYGIKKRKGIEITLKPPLLPRLKPKKL